MNHVNEMALFSKKDDKTPYQREYVGGRASTSRDKKPSPFSKSSPRDPASGGADQTCFICGQSGHKQFSCPKRFCISCGDKSHLLKHCSNKPKACTKNDQGKLLLDGKQICFRYQTDSCTKYHCAFMHQCSLCKASTHGASDCTELHN